MRILVVSDSHGEIVNMLHAVRVTNPQMIFHLGDCWRDGERLHESFPELPFEQVPGNCDYRPDEPVERLLTLGGKRILLCHGHTYHVKTSLMTAGFAAAEQDLDLFLFGHTHVPLWDMRGKTQFLNPGSIGSARPTYGLVEIGNGQLQASVHPLSKED